MENAVLDACALVKRRAGEEIVNKVIERCLKVFVNNKLLTEYRKAARETGFSPIIITDVRLKPLEEGGKLYRVKDDMLQHVAPDHEEDAHIVNLAKTFNALVVTDDKLIIEHLSKKYGLKVINYKEFIKST